MIDSNTNVIHSLDAEDPLGRYRDLFFHGDSDLIYLDGNSLGRLPRATMNHMRHVVADQWGHDLIRGWQKKWMGIQAEVGDKIAKLIGADPGEVIIADSTTINLYRLALSAMLHQAKSHRTRIVTDDLNFPSDVYVFQGITEVIKGSRIEIVKSNDQIHGPVSELAKAMDDHTALLSLTHTVFKSGYTYDMAEVNAAAHEAGALTLWDLSHSVGSVEVDLKKSRADLAVGCCYKYLNGGPGAPAFLYVRKELQEVLSNPTTGWFSQNKMFEMELDYDPADGIRKFTSGTPPVLAISPLNTSLDIFLEVGMDAIRQKSIGLTDLLIHLYDEHLAELGFTLNSPREHKYRGSHISLGHDEGWRINQALINDMNVLPDFRPPDNIRLGLAPLYTSYVDVYTAVMRLRQVVTEKLFENYSNEKTEVT